MGEKNKNINLQNARRKKQREVMEQIKNDGVCPFCVEHLEKYHTEPILEKREGWIVTNNAYPYEGSSTHLLFIHQKHITHASEITKEEWGELHALVEKYVKKFELAGATLLMRFGNTNCTGGTVEHLHAQVVSSDPDSDKEVKTRVA